MNLSMEQTNEVVKILCANCIIIKGDKETIKGHPVDLAKKFTFIKLVNAILFYSEKGRIEVEWVKNNQ